MRALQICCALFILAVMPLSAGPVEHSVARQWNDELLDAIRTDFARPTVHARNLYHTAAAMWDAWAAFDSNAHAVLHDETMTAPDLQAAREEAISHAAYRLLKWRFANSPGAAAALSSFDAKMAELGYDRDNVSTTGDTPAALGNRIARAWIDFGLSDHSNEANGYANLFYEPVNDPLLPDFPGNPDIEDRNRWQPLALQVFVDQGGNVIVGGFPDFLSPEWGAVVPFSLQPEDLTIHQRDGRGWWVYHDPGPPPQLGGAGHEEYKATFERVVLWSSELDPGDGVMMDISPASRGNNTLGTNDGHGRPVNPVTGLPYEPVIVPAGDYYRVLAEFWADGPDSETPPGHWFAIANYVADHPLLVRRIGGEGPELEPLEWDVKVYLALGGAMHDSAVSAWGAKGWYDFVRPISAIRAMCDAGQSSDPGQPSYNPDGTGVNLHPDHIEVITPESSAPGQRHFGLAGGLGQHLGKIAVKAWRGPDYVLNPATDVAGVGWIRCENWWPYQRPSFVTPPFAGYVSGHSTFSRAAATVLTLVTGDEFFPGGYGEFLAPRDEFLVFEDGPSVDVTLRWATYADASDETSISRIYGGIHPPADDIPGRLMGAAIGAEAFARALELYGSPQTETRAAFRVRAEFADGDNPTEVRVTLACDTGLPLTQAFTIDENEEVNFVVTKFDSGQLNCTVTEDTADPALDGYAATYFAAGPGATAGEDGCVFTAVEDQSAFACQIVNDALPVDVVIATEWIIDGQGGNRVDGAHQLELRCTGAIVAGGTPCPGDDCALFSGSGPQVFTAEVIPDYPSSTCYVTDRLFESQVEVLNGCGGLEITAGRGDDCLITYSVFFEGVPAMSRAGLAVLCLLMLGIGLAGARRPGF
jgi:hypothetical protein